MQNAHCGIFVSRIGMGLVNPCHCFPVLIALTCLHDGSRFDLFCQYDPIMICYIGLTGSDSLSKENQLNVINLNIFLFGSGSSGSRPIQPETNRLAPDE